MVGIMWCSEYIVMNETYIVSLLLWSLQANRQTTYKKIALKETNKELWLKRMWLREPLWGDDI